MTDATIPLGIHFDLNEDDYHADPALGSGSIRELAVCPMYYWVDSWMNPLREKREETPALLFGRALHSLVLEGPDQFKRNYLSEPDRDDYPEALDGNDEIKAALKSLGQKVTGNKDELIERLKAADPEAIFWRDICDDVKAQAEKTGATILKRDTYTKIIAAAGFIASDERVKAHFRGGRPEVSIIWEQDGVRCKARLDYVKMGADDHGPLGIITDLKSYANPMGKAPERAVIDAIANNRLDLQTAHYFNGIERIPQFFKEGKVFGTSGIAQDWLDQLAALDPADWRWFWCFYEKDAPVSLLRSTRPSAATNALAKMEVARALNTFKEHMERFGTEWKFIDPIADPEVTMDCLPRWMGAQVGA